MERQQRPGAGDGFTLEATAALRALAGHPAPILLAHHPLYARNPFQSLLYGNAWDEGVAPVAMPRWAQLPELTALQSAGLPTVLHLHWLQRVQRDATSDAEARALAASFLADIDGYRDAGGRLVWTVHNILSHESRFEAAEADLCAAVAARADAIHVMAEATAALVAPHYHLPPDRLIQVPHPSYVGVYPDHITRRAARHELGLMPDEHVVVAVGDIRPYKGLEELLDAWAKVPADRPRRLVIAGSPLAGTGVDPIVERAMLSPRVIVDARYIPPEELQVILCAADAAVLPYRRALNSGALMLALTFGVPVILPDGGGLTEVADDSCSLTYRAGDPDALVDALTRAPELGQVAHEAALRVAAAHEPRALSARFARELRARLDGATGPASTSPTTVEG
jgi:beta-1,4-mannosyltransferase